MRFARSAHPLRNDASDELEALQHRLAKLCGGFWWDLVKVPEDVPASKHAKYRALQLRKKMLGKSLGLLSAALVPVLEANELLKPSRKGDTSAVSEPKYGKRKSRTLPSLKARFPFVCSTFVTTK